MLNQITRFRLGTVFMWVLIAAILSLWWKDHRDLTRKLARYSPTQGTWHAFEATGKPNTPGAGDIPTAWASRTPDSQKEWIELNYARKISPKSIVVHETYNPGAVYKITAYKTDGREVEIWSGTDPTPTGESRGISVFPIKADFAFSRIKVHLDSPAVPGWNEIDAVGLRTWYGRTYWAQEAVASSNYGTRAFGSYTLGGF